MKKQTDITEFLWPEIGEEEKIDVNNILRKIIHHWHWFAIGILLALAIAFYYIHHTPKTYNINAVIQVKENKNGGMNGLQDDLIGQFTIPYLSYNIQDEIYVLKSNTLVSRVVKNLGLQTVYLPEDGSHAERVDLYKKSPVLIQPIRFKNKLSPVVLKVSVNKDATYTISDDETQVTIPQGEIAHLPSGDFMVMNNPEGLDSSYKTLTVIASPITVAVRNFLNRLEVSQTDKTSSILLLTLKTSVPERDQDFLSTLLREYQKLGLEEKNRMATNTIRFVSTRMDSLLLQLDTVETNIVDLMNESGISDIEVQSKLFFDQADRVEEGLTQAQIKLHIVQEISQYINQTSDKGILVPSALGAGIQNSTISSLIAQFNAAQLDRTRLLQSGMKASHPTLQTLDLQINEMRKGIKDNIANLEKEININIKNLEEQKKKFEGQIRKVPGLQKQFLAIRRKHEVKQELYNFLLKKREEASLTKEASVNNISIIDGATVNPKPISPQGRLIYLVALLLGLFVPGGLLYFKETLSNKVSSKKDIESRTSMPVYAEIMFSKKDAPLVVQSGLRSPVAEQFKSLRTNLSFVLGAGGDKKVILVTSSTSGEGKSFISLNLAMSYALLGKRTVLLNLDLRRPTLETYLQLDKKGKTGISNYLSGEAQEDMLVNELTIGNNNLYFINSGPIPPNPTELILQPRMNELIEYLKEHYDYVILDTPPLGLVTDAQILGKYASTSLLIVRHNYTKKNQIEMLDTIYKENKLQGMGIVLNGIRSKDSYRYGYGYGDYNYGYYQSGKKESSVYRKVIESMKRW